MLVWVTLLHLKLLWPYVPESVLIMVLETSYRMLMSIFVGIYVYTYACMYVIIHELAYIYPSAYVLRGVKMYICLEQ